MMWSKEMEMQGGQDSQDGQEGQEMQEDDQ